MESRQITESKKRSLGFIQANELNYKLKSKADFVQYLDKHRKLIFIFILTLY